MSCYTLPNALFTPIATRDRLGRFVAHTLVVCEDYPAVYGVSDEGGVYLPWPSLLETWYYYSKPSNS